MELLSADDYRRVLTAAEGLAADQDHRTFPKRALKAVATVIDLDFASFSEVDLRSGRNRFSVWPDIVALTDDAGTLARFARRFGNHPIVAHQIIGAVGKAGDGGALGPYFNRIRLMGMIGNCCGEAALLLSMGLGDDADRRHLVGIAINRGVREFDAFDAARMAALRPHIAAAYRAALRFEQAAGPHDPPAGVVSGLTLTEREGQVLHWVAMGKSNEEVGTIIGARPATVKKHLEHIYDKLGVPNRTAAATAFRRAALPF